MLETLSIGQLAKKANVSNRTLRYYEELGLIAPKNRGSNRYRYYDESHLQRIHTIKMLQESGFALKEIVAALSPMLDPSGNVTYAGQEIAKKIFGALSEQHAKLVTHQRELEATVSELQRTMLQLKDCFGCTVSTTLEDCAQCGRGPTEVTRLGNQALEHRINNTPTPSLHTSSPSSSALLETR
jgi:MerR family copper efflux transcriptional regulator